MTRFRFLQWQTDDGQLHTCVELNDDFPLLFKVGVRDTSKHKIGDDIYLRDIEGTDAEMECPSRDGKRCAFFLWFRTFLSAYVSFDFTPNYPDFSNGQEDSLRPFHNFDKLCITSHHLNVLQPLKKLPVLVKTGWPPSPGLYPAVFAYMHDHPNISADAEFLSVAIASHSEFYWKSRLTSWEQQGIFRDRFSYVARALQAHLNEDYAVAVYVIMPQFEGIIREWVTRNGKKPARDFNCVIEQFSSILLSRKATLYPIAVFRAVIDFLRETTFWKHSGSVKHPQSQLTRNGVLHGIVTGFECEELSLKAFMLLDSLAHVLWHDYIVSGHIIPPMTNEGKLVTFDQVAKT